MRRARRRAWLGPTMDKRQAGAGARGGAGWRLPTPQELLVGADCPDADLLIDDIHAAEAEGTGGRAQPGERTPRPPPAGGSLQDHRLSPPHGAGWSSRPLTCRSRPHSDTACRACVWSRGGYTGTAPRGSLGDTWGQRAAVQGSELGAAPNRTPRGPALGARNPCTLRPSLDTRTHTLTKTHMPTHTQHCRTFQAAQFCPTLLYTCKLTTAPRGLYPNRLKFKHKPTATHRPGNARQPHRSTITWDGSPPPHRPGGSWRGRPQRAGLPAPQHHSLGGLPASRSPPRV